MLRRTERAQRNPMFWFRFSGSFLFRFAERRFLGSLSKEPPRSTRGRLFPRFDQCAPSAGRAPSRCCGQGAGSSVAVAVQGADLAADAVGPLQRVQRAPLVL